MDDILITLLQGLDMPVSVAFLVWLIWDERKAHRAERDAWYAESRDLIDELFKRLNGKPKPPDDLNRLN